MKNTPKLNVYAAISIEGKTNIRFYDENLTSKLYTKILDDTLLPAAQRLYRNRKFTYVQDNDPKHTAAHTRQHMARQMKQVIPIEGWPANSPDLNPIENLWSTLDEKVARKHPTSIRSMKQIIAQQWRQMATDEVRSTLINSIPNRLQEVIKK